MSRTGAVIACAAAGLILILGSASSAVRSGVYLSESGVLHTDDVSVAPPEDVPPAQESGAVALTESAGDAADEDLMDQAEPEVPSVEDEAQGLAYESESEADEPDSAADADHNGDAAADDADSADGDIVTPPESIAVEVACCEAGCCDFCRPDISVQNWIEVGLAVVSVTGNSDSVEQYGVLPEGAYTSGRIHSGNSRGHYGWERMEARWQHVARDTGRGWGRLALWPLTLQGDSMLISGRAWDSFEADPRLAEQTATLDSLRLRLHSGEFRNAELSYELFELKRSGPTTLGDLRVQRLAGRHNFELGGGRALGQVRQIATVIDSDAAGATGKIDQTRIKLDARLGDRTTAYTRLDYSAFDYDELPDPKFAGADWTLGLRYRPDACWLLNAEFRTQEKPDDNTVSSHIRSMTEGGLAVSYMPGKRQSYELGYKVRQLDYAKLNMQDPAVFSLLRQSSTVTPGDVGHAVEVLTPAYDVVWADIRHNLTDDLRLTTRVDYSQGDAPSSELTAAGSPSLLFDKQLRRQHGLSYALDCRNQLELGIHSQESLNPGRDSRFMQNYVEGVWSHTIDRSSSFSLAYRNTDVSLNSPGFAGSLYTTDDVTYAATFGQRRERVDYSMNLSVSEGSGAEVYKQTAAGAGIRFKDVPLGLRVDWYDRNYSKFAGLSAEALSFGVDYRFEF